RLLSPQAWNSEEPRRACPARRQAPPFLAWCTTSTATPYRRCSSRRKATRGATSPLAFSSMRCSRTNGSRTQPGPQPVDGLGEVAPIGLEVEAQGRRGDDLDIEIGEPRAGGGGDAVEAMADDVQGVLGSVEQDASGPGHDEAAQARRAGGDRSQVAPSAVTSRSASPRWPSNTSSFLSRITTVACAASSPVKVKW